MNKPLVFSALLAFCTHSFVGAAEAPASEPREWFVGCKVDRFTDERTCSVGTPVLKVGGVDVDLTATRAVISFGVSDHPSFPARVRINSNPVEAGGTLFTDPKQVERLLSQMEQGGTALVRLQKWPSRTVDYQLDLTHFADGLARARRSLAEGCVDQHPVVLPPILNTLSEEGRRNIQAMRDKNAAAFAAVQCKVLTPRANF